MQPAMNAQIKSTMLGIEDHDIFTFMLHLDYGGAGQGAGGYALDGGTPRKGWGGGILLLRRILEVVGVDRWEQLPGKHIRVVADRDKVYAIGHILKDDWLNFKTFVEGNKP